MQQARQQPSSAAPAAASILRSAPKAMHCAVRGALLSLALAAPLQHAIAAETNATAASANAARRHFDISAGPLGDALSRFASSAGVTMQMD
ncbi:hypothetical protein, partial [Herbaspirillum sp. 3C11]